TSTAIYTLTVTGSNGCSATDFVTVNVNTIPPIADADTNRVICLGMSILIGTNGLPGNIYTWTPSNGLNDSTLAQPLATPASTTIYTLNVVGPNGCNAIDTVTVSVNNCTINISGTVYHDQDGASNSKVDGIGISNPNGVNLYVHYADTNNIVLGVTQVALDGTFEFKNVSPNQAYRLNITTIQGTIGNPLPNNILPPSWYCTGEDCCDQIGDDGQTDGMNHIFVSNADLENIDFGINNSSMVFPLTLKKFYLSEFNCSSLITYITSNEINTSHVDIYRREISQNNFNKIATILSSGASIEDQVYSYLDNQVVQDKVYEYLLKFVDLDHNTSVSETKTISLNCSNQSSEFYIFPNPASNELNILFVNESQDIELKLEIIDFSGRTIMSQSKFMREGANLLKFDLSHLSNGMYMVNYTNVDGLLFGSQKFTKQ
ncbi:MAG TPA: T9SS type A sorting domain-containing protein, partial [Chitinophagaceae bacterium]|nr:T9SS type A sorting domain-containing protein [Chitinophagaceae bacterium]